MIGRDLFDGLYYIFLALTWPFWLYCTESGFKNKWWNLFRLLGLVILCLFLLSIGFWFGTGAWGASGVLAAVYFIWGVALVLLYNAFDREFTLNETR